MAVLAHATAVVIGTTGVALVGPSGSGKSSTALELIAGARHAGHFAALLSDDQIFVDAVNGHLVAHAPRSIRGMIELYGSGIGHVETIETAVLALALQPIAADSSNRIPEENQRWSPMDGVSLPLYFIDRRAADPFFRLTALISGFPVSGSFQL
jgi:serine kinase of HPr protein (carbohydrate metabolism regulator)